MSDMIFALITGILSVVLYIYVSFAARGKGPILSNTYLFATKEERKKMDLKAEYRLATVVYSLVATAFALLTVFIICEKDLVLFLAVAVLAAALVYAVRESAQTVKTENTEQISQTQNPRKRK